MPTSVMSPSPVTTTRPPLPIASNAWAMCSPLMHTDGHHRLVGALPVGDAARELGGLLDARERLGRTEFHRLLALEGDRVDGDDVAGAGVRRALDGVDADAADAHDDHRLTGPDLRRVHRGSPSGADAAAGEAGDLERDVVRDLDRGPAWTVVTSANVPMPHIWPTGAPVGRGDPEALEVVEAGAHEQPGAEVAEVGLAARAPATLAAARGGTRRRRGRRPRSPWCWGRRR